MRVIIAGSRDMNSYQELLKVIKKANFRITTIISGGARGVDTLGERYAMENDIPLKIFPADWNEYGKSAGYIRNLQMAEQADALIAICKNKSKGTMHMIRLANDKKLQYYVSYL